MRASAWKSSCRFTSSDLFSTIVISWSIFKMITAKILTSDYLTNILYVAAFIITMFIELKENDFRLNVNLELTLVKVASRCFNCSINFLFWLNWDVTKVKDLFSIWVEVKLFSFVIDLLLESRAIDFWLVELKFENRRKSICISITRSILLDWLHQVEYLSSSQVFDSSRLDLSQNS